MIVDLFVFIYLAISFSNCNGLKSRGNLCNDPLWCCIPDVYTITANQCPLGPCTMAIPPVTLPTTLNDLSANILFVWTFWVTLGFLVLGVILLIFSIIVNVYDAQYRLKRELKRKKDQGFFDKDDDEEKDEMDIETSISKSKPIGKINTHVTVSGSVRQRK